MLCDFIFIMLDKMRWDHSTVAGDSDSGLEVFIMTEIDCTLKM